MSETKFTPGPWYLEAGYENSNPGDFDEYWQVHDGQDAIVCSSSFCMAGNKEANAHLIAAAPELYEALVDVMAEISSLGNIDYHFGGTGPFDKARAALAKARGETP